MIIKKLYRRTRCRWWDEKRKVYECTTVTEYLGWFLFGIIPIYLIELDKYEDVDFEKSGKGIINFGINEQYRHLMIK